ncbi:MAG: alpha/beta hydrolase [Candidatus Xenobia bacterium]
MGRLGRRLMWWLGVPVGLYVALCTLVYCKQAALLYFPEPDTSARPPVAFTALTLKTPDGVSIDAWAVPGEASAPWVLFCHGNAGNISGRVDTVMTLHEMGVNLVMFDYRGYGRSSGTPTEAGLYADAMTCYQWLTETQHVAPQRIVVFGESLGGGVATGLAAQVAVGGLVLQSTFTSVPDVGVRVYPLLPVRLLARDRFPSLARIGSIKCPKLIMHSPQDDTIPFDMGRQLYEAAGEPRTFVELTGGHNWPLSEQAPKVRESLKAFLYKI